MSGANITSVTSTESKRSKAGTNRVKHTTLRDPTYGQIVSYTMQLFLCVVRKGSGFRTDLHTIKPSVEHPFHVLRVVRWAPSRLHADAVVEVGPNFKPERVALVNESPHVLEPVFAHYWGSLSVVKRARVGREAEIWALGQAGVFVLPCRAVALLPPVIHRNPVKAKIWLRSHAQ